MDRGYGTAGRAGAGVPAAEAARDGRLYRPEVALDETTVAGRLERALRAARVCTVLLDGDELRRRLSRDLGSSEAGRAENVRRTAEVARLAVEAGLMAVVALVSPFRAGRRRARGLMAEGAFVEVFVDTPLAVCEARDPKGLHRRARADEIAEFTGIG